MYVVATLGGGKKWETHDEAFIDYKDRPDEFKAIFFKDDGADDQMEGVGVNVSGSVFDMRHEQLKTVAERVFSDLPLASDVFISLSDTGFSEPKYVATIKGDAEDLELGPYLIDDGTKGILTTYPLITEMPWKDLGSDKFELKTNDVNLRIDSDALIATVKGSSYILVPSSMEESVDTLKNYGREYIDMVNEAMSLGWKSEDVLPNPVTQKVGFRDPAAEDVWNTVDRVKMSSVTPPETQKKMNHSETFVYSASELLEAMDRTKKVGWQDDEWASDVVNAAHASGLVNRSSLTQAELTDAGAKLLNEFLYRPLLGGQTAVFEFEDDFEKEIFSLYDSKIENFLDLQESRSSLIGKSKFANVDGVLHSTTSDLEANSPLGEKFQFIDTDTIDNGMGRVFDLIDQEAGSHVSSQESNTLKR